MGEFFSVKNRNKTPMGYAKPRLSGAETEPRQMSRYVPPWASGEPARRSDYILNAHLFHTHK
jgi:hypothetical protein